MNNKLNNVITPENRMTIDKNNKCTSVYKNKIKKPPLSTSLREYSGNAIFHPIFLHLVLYFLYFSVNFSPVQINIYKKILCSSKFPPKVHN